MATPETASVLNASWAATLAGKDVVRFSSSSTSETSSSTEDHNRIYSNGRLTNTYEYSFSGPLGSTYYSSTSYGQWWVLDSGETNGTYQARIAVYWYDSTESSYVGTVDVWEVTTANGVDFTVGGNVYGSTAITDASGVGNDLLDSSSTATLGPTLLGKGGDDTLIGNDSHADQLFGGPGNDSLEGRDGDDRLYGQEGNDTLKGGAGTDVALLFSPQMAFTFTANGGDSYSVAGPEGTELLVGIEYVQFEGSAPVAIATLVSSSGPSAGDDTVNGTPGNDSLDGLAGNDLLNGLDGNDTLNGGPGADTLVGGPGNDTFVVDEVGDVVTEAAAGGTDLVKSGVSFSFAVAGRAQLEKLTLTGTAVINGTGNSLANILTGNAGNNLLKGLVASDLLVGNAGNDTLDGGVGADSLRGGTGNDTYVVDDAGDLVTESSDTVNGGTDLVKASVTVTLGDYLEKLTLTGTTAINGTGNGLANNLVGNAAANELKGLGGNDTLLGGGGADRLVGGSGKDSLTGGAGNDVFDFNAIGETPAGANRDLIADFAAGDSIDLATIDANVGVANNQAFTLINGAAFTGPGQLFYDTTTSTLWGNNDADLIAEFSIEVRLSGLSTLVAGDFVL